MNNEILFVVIDYAEDPIFQHYTSTNTHYPLFLFGFSP